MTSLNAQVEELARMDNQYEAGFVAQENKPAVKLVQSHWREITAEAQSRLYHPSKFLCEIRMLGRRRRSCVRRHVGSVPFFKFHQLGNHSEGRLQVGHTRIVFISELLDHSLKVNISSLDLILS
jgi:hypothetical protein